MPSTFPLPPRLHPPSPATHSTHHAIIDVLAGSQLGGGEAGGEGIALEGPLADQGVGGGLQHGVGEEEQGRGEADAEILGRHLHRRKVRKVKRGKTANLTRVMSYG